MGGLGGGGGDSKPSFEDLEPESDSDDEELPDLEWRPDMETVKTKQSHQYFSSSLLFEAWDGKMDHKSLTKPINRPVVQL